MNKEVETKILCGMMLLIILPLQISLAAKLQANQNKHKNSKKQKPSKLDGLIPTDMEQGE